MMQMHTDRICVSTLCLHMTYLYQYAGQGRSHRRAKEAQAPPLGSGVIHVKGPNSRFFPCLWGGSRIRIRDEYLPLPPPPPLWASPGYATAGVQYTFYLYCVTITLHRTHCTLLPPTVSACSKIAMKYPGFCCSLRPLEEGGCSSEFFQDD